MPSVYLWLDNVMVVGLRLQLKGHGFNCQFDRSLSSGHYLDG